MALLTFQGIYKNGKIEILEAPEDISESKVLITFLDTPESASQKPSSLRGLWKNRFPADFDLDHALKEIRSEWESNGETNNQ
ncbi:MAG: hypothetical protein KIT45_02250 [Fimbriimonadia bacterium]|nr:hypothetical protein [Fimbriimonadia bacterium]